MMRCNGLAVTISPPFGSRANAATVAFDLIGVRTIDRRSTPRRMTAPRPGWHRTGRSRLPWPDPEGPPLASHRRDLLEQLQPFCRSYRIRTVVKPVALPPGRARLSTKPAPTGSMTMHEHDRHGAGCLLQRRHRRIDRAARITSGASATNSAAYLRTDRDRRSPPSVDPHVAAVGPAQLLQPLHERPDAGLPFRIVRGRGHQHADAPHALGLLRARRERPRDCPAAKHREIRDVAWPPPSPRRRHRRLKREHLPPRPSLLQHENAGQMTRWVEPRKRGDDLAGSAWLFLEGIDWRLPQHTWRPPGGRLIVAF